MPNELISPPGAITPEMEEELRAYSTALRGIPAATIQGDNPFMNASPWRIVLGALQGVQSRSALEASEGARAGRRTRQARHLPHVVSVFPGTTSTDPTSTVTTTTAPTAAAEGINPNYLSTLTRIEASDDPTKVAPSGLYRGLGMFSRDLERRYGITDWTNPEQQRRAIIEHAQYHRGIFRQRLQREPSPGELYLMHQQGAGGGLALLQAPTESAYDVLMRLPYYRNKRNPPYAVRTAIENNLPDELKGRWRNMTAGEFANQWVNRFNRDVERRPTVSAPGVSVPLTLRQRPVTSLPVGPGGVADTEGIMRLGGPQEEAEAGPKGPQLESGPPLQPGQELFGAGRGAIPSYTVGASASPPSPSPGAPLETISGPPGAEVGQPGYFASGVPPGVPRQIQVNPALTSILQRLRDPLASNQAEFNNLLAEYQKLAVPTERDTTFGKATYDPFTGRLTDFVPGPVLRTPLSVPGVSTEEILAPNPSTQPGAAPLTRVTPGGGVTAAPGGGVTAAPGGGVTAAPGGGVTAAPGTVTGAPSITPRLPPFPRSGSISEMSAWGMHASAVKDMIDKMGSAHADRVATAARAGQRASERLNMLQSIATLTDAAATTRWTGQPLSRWQMQMSQFLINFDPRHRGQRPETLNQLGYKELLQKLNAFLASEATQDISARGTNFEFRTLLENNPNLTSSFEGTQMLVSYMMQEQQRIADLAEMASQLHPDQFPNWTRIVREHYRVNPIYIEIPQTRNTQTGEVSPAMRITTVRIPRVGDLLPDGRGTYNSAAVTEFIRSLPPGTWFIDPLTRRPLPAHPPQR